MTLRIKASILLGVIISVALGISSYYSLLFFEDSLRGSILESLTSVNDTSSREVSRFLSDSLKEAEAVAQALPKIALEQKNARLTDDILKSYSTIFKKFENGMFILDENGTLWSDYPEHPDVRGKSFAFRQYFQKTMADQTGIVGVPYKSLRTGNPVVTFTALLKDSDGHIAGMLGCSVQLTSPNALEGIRLTPIGESGYIYVYNKDRLMILHPQEDRILEKDVPVGANKLFDAAIEGFEGTGETVNSRGVAMLISMKQIPGSDWIIGAQQPTNEAFAPIKSAKIKIIWGIFFVAMISVIIGAFLMKGITKPLIKLQDAIKKIGNFGEKDNGLLLNNDFRDELDEIKGGVEVENLKTAFTTMSEKLDHTLRSLHNLAGDWKNTFDSVLDIIILLDEHHKIVRLNHAAESLFNKPYQALIGQPIFDFLAIIPERILLACETTTGKDKSFNINVKGNQVYEIFCNSLNDDRNNVIGKVLVGRDITFRLEATREKLRLEEKLQKAHKMEAIGTLVGGVAHDLNNILSGIVSYPELLLLQVPQDSPLVKPLETILQSGNKATAIVQDLLTLSRRGAATFDVVNMNTIVKEYLNSPEYNKLKSYHPDVNTTVNLAPDLFNIEGSTVHLSKTIMNLVSNAAEAMPDGGNIHISTENRYVDTQIKGHEDILEGDYVILTVMDEGLGIEVDDFDRIFEPFYTKKKMGRSGTGLGMSVVWGTVKDHKGHIDLKSTIGSGTTFKIYLPITRKAMHGPDDALDIRRLYGNNESILVVDDVEAQRTIAISILAQLGYSVRSAASGEAALAHLKDNPVDLLVLDMIMLPGINGLETYTRALELRPNQKAIITSGYSETEFVKQAQAIGAGSYVKKPYSIEKIGLAVKKELSKECNRDSQAAE
jgi:signal transduction histidine kinase/CheY-like chemotaxis protein